MSEGQGSSGLIDTGLEEAAAYVANASKGAAAAASVDTGFDTTPVTATLSPALAPAPETVETGFDDLSKTPAPVQPAAPTVNAEADTGEPEGAIDTGIEEALAHLASVSKDPSSTPDGSVQSKAAEQPRPAADDPGHHVGETLKAAQSYIRADWKTFPGKRGNHDHRDKEPLAGWSWTKRHLTLAEAATYFDKDQFNVLVALGENSGNLIDIDLDWPEAAAAADIIFNDLPSFGRCGKPRSHRLAKCADIKSKKFLLPPSLANHSKVVGQPEHMMCIAELRGGGSYTVFPGSQHQTGQKVEWTDTSTNNTASIPDIEPEILIKKMKLLSFVAFCMRLFPAVGTRCDHMMAAAGALARAR